MATDPPPLESFAPNIVKAATSIYNTMNRVNQIMHGIDPNSISDATALRAIANLAYGINVATSYSSAIGVLELVRDGLKRGSVTAKPILIRDENATEWPVRSLLEIINEELAQHGR